jgi:hypothetical protein
MMSRQPGVAAQAASGSSHSAHKQSLQASPELQRACPGPAPPPAPGVAPPLPALGGSALPPAPEPPPDAAACPLPGAAPPEPTFDGAIGATGMASPLTSEAPAPTASGPPLGAVPPSATLFEAAMSAPAGAAGPGTPLSQPGSSQVNVASWIPSTELHADAASRTAMLALALTPRHDALACRLCLRDLLITRHRSGLQNFAFWPHHSIAAARSASALGERFERDHRGKKASSERQSEARTAERSPNGRAKPEPTCFGLSAAQLSFALPSVWWTWRR